MKFILGKKLDMTQVWQSDDKVVAVTRVEISPCVVTQVKTNEKDGYTAVQVGCGEKKEKRIKKPQKGHLKDLGNLRNLREFRIEDSGELKRGDVIDPASFSVGDEVQVCSISKGKGFQGVVKRHGFHGHNKTHGTKDQVRMPGSSGATGPAHVFKGMRGPGRMGGDQVTIKNMEVVEVDLENNILSIKGSVPGARNGLVLISGEGDLKLKIADKKEDKKEKEEEAKTAEVQPEENIAQEAKESNQDESGENAGAKPEVKESESNQENAKETVEEIKNKEEKKSE